MRIVKFYINVIISNMITFNGTLMEGSGLTNVLRKRWSKRMNFEFLNEALMINFTFIQTV